MTTLPAKQSASMDVRENTLPSIWNSFRNSKCQKYFPQIRTSLSRLQLLPLPHRSAILSNRPLPKMDAVQYPEAIPIHSLNSRRDILSWLPSKPSMHGEPNAGASTSTAASTCDSRPYPMPSAAPAVAGSIYAFINLILWIWLLTSKFLTSKSIIHVSRHIWMPFQKFFVTLYLK